MLNASASDAALVLAHQGLAGALDEVATASRPTARPGVIGMLFTADALHCQKHSFARAAATGNPLLVRVKACQPTLNAPVTEAVRHTVPVHSHEAVNRGGQEHRRVKVFHTAGHLEAR